MVKVERAYRSRSVSESACFCNSDAASPLLRKLESVSLALLTPLQIQIYTCNFDLQRLHNSIRKVACYIYNPAGLVEL